MSKHNQTLFASALILCMIQTSHAAKLIPATDSSGSESTTIKSKPAISQPENTPNRINIAATPAAEAPAKPATPVTPPPATVTAPAMRTSASSGIDTGFYLGAQLGDSSVGAVIGYQFTKMVGMEISYDYFDPIYTRAVTTTLAEKNRLGASMLAMFPIKFSDMGPMALYVKVGYARTTDKVTTDDPGPPVASTFITTTTKTGVTGGAGVHVDMSQNASVRLGVNVVGAERTTYLAALYRF